MQNSKHLLVIGFVWPEPKSSAAGNRMMQLMALFQANGYHITFASSAQNFEFSEDLSRLGIDTQTIELNSTTFDDFVRELKPDVVLFDRFMVEEQFGWRVSDNCPNALKILDTEDLHCLRLARQLAVKEHRKFTSDDLYSDMAKREIASILRCDLSLMVSEYEMEVLQQQFKVSKELLYYLPIFVERLNEIPTCAERHDFVFIGNFLHEPNWDCAKYLSESIWPLLHKKLPEAKLLIYGAYPTQKVLELHKPKQHFYIMGRAEDAMDVIKKARVVLAPIRFGAGIKGKLLEAMQCGTPSVTSSVGAESMAGTLDWNGFVKDNLNEFVEAAVELYENEKLWQQCQEKGFEILDKRYKKSLFEKNFIDEIDSTLANLKEHRNANFIGAILQHHMVSSTKFMSKWIEEKNKK
ncbi:glycosyltransferase family 4 protein [Flavobacterium aciduliphilum]|uniref:Glycosyltransferase involved in cell wall biosynthesis n=1 Tax=Flavobacterium aciduliphilum TaxID=1101402 RepID=A0A328YN40_9FLAO|nr:glycosyltransferase family 4 protein [Flavobacterium aciduliphilum]RAR74255.1 glycosyltransferase involved in cell wall biosynthesis [Flavobacterium aciduliphilum]